MKSKIRHIPVKSKLGTDIGTAELEVDSDAGAAWLEVILHKQTALTLHEGLETLQYTGITLDATHAPVAVRGGIRYHQKFPPPEYGSDGKAYEGSYPRPGTTVPPFNLLAAMQETSRPGYPLPPPIDPRMVDVRIKEGSTPPVDPTHPHYADFDLDPNNRTLGEEEINNRFGFHKATLEGPNATAPRHAYLRNEFKAFADMLDRVLPPGRYKNLAMTSLEEGAMWSHKSIAEKAPAGE